MLQGYEQSFQSLEFSSYMPQYSFQAPTNVAYISPPSSFCYHPSLSTQMHDMSHEDEEEDDDNNNTNNNDDVP